MYIWRHEIYVWCKQICSFQDYQTLSLLPWTSRKSLRQSIYNFRESPGFSSHSFKVLEKRVNTTFSSFFSPNVPLCSLEHFTSCFVGNNLIHATPLRLSYFLHNALFIEHPEMAHTHKCIVTSSSHLVRLANGFIFMPKMLYNTLTVTPTLEFISTFVFITITSKHCATDIGTVGLW